MNDPGFVHEAHELPALARVGLGEALRRYPFLAVLAVLVLGALGAAAGLTRSTTFTATAQTVVEEPTTPNAAQLPGVVQASQEFAANASRLVSSSAVVQPLARLVHATPDVIANDLSATPIPQSSLIKVVAKSHSREFSVALANRAATLFSTYATSQAKNPAAARATLQEFQSASARYRRALLTQQGLQSAKPPASETALVHAAAVTEAQRLRQQTLSASYRIAIEANANAPQVIVFLPARGASSNRKSNLEIFLFAGVVAGLVVGAALALALANRKRAPLTSA